MYWKCEACDAKWRQGGHKDCPACGSTDIRAESKEDEK